MKVEINSLDHFGRGICSVNDKICFVENALPKEVVEIDLVKEKKKYCEARVISYDKTSLERKKVECRYYENCGGCNIKHMQNDVQDNFKTNKIKEIVNKFSKIDSKLIRNIKSNHIKYYRNKVIFHVHNGLIGIYEKNTNTVIDIEECLIVNKKINKMLPILRKVVKENKNIKEIMVRVGNKTDEVLVSIKGKVDNYKELLGEVDVLVINGECVTKENTINSYILGVKFKVSNKSFFQINESMTEKVYQNIIDEVKCIKPKKILDLYCGVGTISLIVSKYVDSVIGIESVREAVIDAKDNKKINKIENVSFIKGKVEDKIKDIIEDIDMIIVDPPRIGLDKITIDNILKINPKTIIYVSCDPVTMTRDLSILNEKYDVSYIQPFDMFVDSYHVECVCVLKLR